MVKRNVIIKKCDVMKEDSVLNIGLSKSRPSDVLYIKENMSIEMPYSLDVLITVRSL